MRLTGHDAVKVEGSKGAVHEYACGGGLVAAKPVVHDEGVVAVVEVGGFIEEKAAMLHRSIVPLHDELGVHELRLGQL